MAAFPGFREFTLVKADGTALGRIMLAEPVVDDPMIERMWKILDAQDPIKKLAIV